jgi:hypothetical protein
MATSDEELRAEIVAAGWTINVERPEEVTRGDDNFTVVHAHYSASKETRPVSVAGSLKQLRDVCLGSDAAVASRKPEPVPAEVEVVAVPTLEDVAAQVVELQTKLAAAEEAAA